MEAIVLAGGLGTRLRSSVSDLPKCLAPIGFLSSGVAEGCCFKTALRCAPGPSRSLRDHPYPLTWPRVATGFETTPSSTPPDSIPFLYYLLEELGRQGVTRVILSVGYLKEKVMAYVNGQEWPFEVAWAVEEEPLGTGGAIRLALVLNGDTFFHVELADLLAVEAPVALALQPMRDFDRYGAVVLGENGIVTSFQEKRYCREGLVNGGVYALDRTLFDGYSHDFRPGSKTALMGTTGAGKTTLFRLMLALVKPAAGTIELYDAASSQPVSPETRADFVFVPQGNTLMSGSVRFNLQLARPSATDEELRKVLHTAAADFVFDLPDGLDTELGERGVGLSEGQAQRIAIARGLLRPGSILLLDEISAALDEATERELFSRIFADFPQRTMIFITHRPAVASLCDETLQI